MDRFSLYPTDLRSSSKNAVEHRRGFPMSLRNKDQRRNTRNTPNLLSSRPKSKKQSSALTALIAGGQQQLKE
ncbi:hypothetical protein T265_08789 [Opisthorchis viverrini]|uniref:Uncharacterized protein n=1 Tax=Opisthorchis viverrini TaxID=6198 RepID=A0A074ZIY8_OPIVI|nr:hypothetical protein T265_08789 [Opisthorchis viverrini]KER23305.1 hypothetical protein T265_08789 [Opisthorchis viverrini]